MRIISGKFKGRKIPFKNSKFNDADITTDKVKEALFSIIGNQIKEKSFIDLFSCSGQIGIEALSWGAKYVVLNEINRKRYNFLVTLKELYNENNNLQIYNFPMKKCVKFLHEENIKFDYIFLDPPYIKEKGEVKFYEELLMHLAEFPIYHDDTVITIQHYSKNILKDNYENFEKVHYKKYGNTSLTFFRITDKG